MNLYNIEYTKYVEQGKWFLNAENISWAFA